MIPEKNISEIAYQIMHEKVDDSTRELHSVTSVQCRT